MAPPSQHPSIGHSVLAALEETCVSKSIMFFLNLVVFFVGVLIAVAAGIAVNEVGKLDEEFASVLEDNPEILSGLYCILATGAILAFVGFCGCCGSLCEQDAVMLVLFLLLLIAMFLCQLMAFAFAFAKMPRVEGVLRESMEFVQTSWLPLESTDQEIEEYLEHLDHHVPNQTEEQYTLAWIKMQDKFKCCGYDSPEDWMEVLEVPSYAAYCTENALQDLTASNTATRDITRSESFRNRIEDLSKQDTWPYGCREVVFVKLAKVMAISSIVVFLIELIIILMSCFLVHKAVKQHKAKRAKINTQSVEEDEE